MAWPKEPSQGSVQAAVTVQGVSRETHDSDAKGNHTPKTALFLIIASTDPAGCRPRPTQPSSITFLSIPKKKMHYFSTLIKV